MDDSVSGDFFSVIDYDVNSLLTTYTITTWIVKVENIDSYIEPEIA